MDFEKLYHAYFMEVYSFCLTIVKDACLAEEIAQETFFKAIRTEHSYQGKSSEITWLCAIAKNICMDALRRQKRVAPMVDMEQSGTASTEKNAIDKLTVFQIHQVLHKMEEPYKEVFQLRIFGELSFADIGKIFGKTENWARVTYHRARLKLQERMEHYE